MSCNHSDVFRIYFNRKGVLRMHYTFSGNEKTVMGLNGKMIVVRQIQAIQTFTFQTYVIKAGDRGGWIECMDNLPQGSYAWIDKKSILGEGAVVKDRSYLKESTLLGEIFCEKESRISHSVIKNESHSNPMLISASHVFRTNLDSPELVNIKNCTLTDVEGYQDTYLKIREKVTVDKTLDPKLHLSGHVKFVMCNTEDVIHGENVNGIFHNSHFKGDIRLEGTFHVVDSSITNLHMGNGKRYDLKKVHFESEVGGFIYAGCDWNYTKIKARDFYGLKHSKMDTVTFKNVKELTINSTLHMKNVTWEAYNGESCHLEFAGDKNVIMANENTFMTVKVSRLRMTDSNILDGAVISGFQFVLIDVCLSGFTSLKSEYEANLIIERLTMEDFSSIQVTGKMNGKVQELSLKDDESLSLTF